MLVPLGGHKDFISNFGFNNDTLARVIGLAKHQSDDEQFSPQRALAELRELYEQTETAEAEAKVGFPLSSNVEQLSRLVNLNETECRILEFATLLHSEKLLDDTADWIGYLSSTKVVSTVATLLGLPEGDVRAAFKSHSILSQSGLVAIDHRGAMTLRAKIDLLSEDFADTMRSVTEVDPVALLKGTVSAVPPASLSLQDYEHVGPSLKILIPYLRQASSCQRVGVNFLIHGPPGVGKSQLARILPNELGLQTFEVSSEDCDGDPINGERRLRAFRAAQSFFGKQRGLIIFDEVEDVFNDGEDGPGRRGGAQARKAWMNRMLEQNPVPCIWLTNSIRGFDPAFIRRFDMVVEVTVPAKAQRHKILTNYCGSLISEGQLARISEVETLAPAVVERAASVVRVIADSLTTEERCSALEQLLSSTLEAQGHQRLRGLNDANQLPETYAPEFINSDADLELVARGIDNARTARLLLAGPPGTGKTAYGRWLARQLSMPIIVKRASDLMSKWVGESERNIAAAFEQARLDNALLLVDEIDSFIQDRRGASRGWEVAMVNEWLTQLESFSGVFVASTNLMDGIDTAAIRRFDLKVKFDFLKSGQARLLFERHCKQIGLDDIGASASDRVANLSALTPGDFAAVVRQHRFRPLRSAADFASALAKETHFKVAAKAKIGFI
jgi:SpoVK/Ycf46/Vps4 family AAA+-type ATPase